MNSDLLNLQRKVAAYKEVLHNTITYRQAWHDRLKGVIADYLLQLAEQGGLQGIIEERADLVNLEAIVFSLGDEKSGVAKELTSNIMRDMIKHNGSLIYQQLFNGKILVMMNYPYIEGYGEPAPPRTLGIYRPEELKPPFLLRHMETFVQEITLWEDYDDDDNGAAHASQRIGFKMNFETPPGE
ncbi:MAG: hypothetical protein KA479_07440 [Saprospiraceae bacterium]|jgi:hypothetical protein|nr:hypothetical protein [Saprospiraceae bacterium]